MVPIEVEPVVEAKPLEMARKSGGPNSIGMPKCKKPWKFGSERSAS